MTAFNDDVDIAVEVGFGSGPYATSPTWVDITDKVRAITIDRGRSHDLDTVAASTLRVMVDNYTGDFDPTNTSGTYYPDVVPMVPIRVVATYDSTDYPLFRGMVESWPMRWADNDPLVTIEAMDGMKLLNMLNTNGAEVEELSGARIGHLLDDAGWPAGWRSLDTGDVTCAAYTPACSSILTLIRQVTDTEFGSFFIDGAGDAVFQEQTHRAGASSVATFGDTDGEIRYLSDDFALAYDDIQIWNRVEITRVGGATVAAENTTSIAAYGERMLSRFDTLHVDDTVATTEATNLLTRYKDPHVRLDTMTVEPMRTPTAWGTILGLELSDLITVKRRPPAGNTIDIDVFVESIRTTITRDREWRTTFSGTQYV